MNEAADDVPVLWHFPVSHFNEKVRWALDRKKVPHRRVALVPGFHVVTVRRLTGQQKVPVIRLGGRVIHDSPRILEALEEAYPDPPIFPADPALRARALELQQVFDTEAAPDFRRLFWSCYVDDAAAACAMAVMGPTNGSARALAWRAAWPMMKPIFCREMGVVPEVLEGARARLPGHLDRVAAAIGPSGYLVGEAFSVADLTAAAGLTALLRPPQFPYPLPEPWPPGLVALRESIVDHEASRWALRIYATERDASMAIGEAPTA